MPPRSANPARPHVVIVGGGFAGLACARALGGAEIDVTVIDRRNHNLFQPLLYQVATAALSPADIAEPIRDALGRHRNVRVLLAEVTGIDHEGRFLLTDRLPPIAYDRLVLATGSDYSYFGKDHWRALAPGLKTIREARVIRQRLLMAFETAEATRDREEKAHLLTSVIIGGGPTGVEMAGAMVELGRFTAAHDHRNISPRDTRVVLVEAGPRLLPAFPQDLAAYAEQRLRRLGVEVMTGVAVEAMSEGEVVVAGGRSIPAGTVVWAAGTKATPAAQWLGIEPEKGGRIAVTPHLEVPGREGIYVLGDLAHLQDPESGEALPGLAQVAKQQGRWLGRSLRRLAETGERGAPFRFRNRGNTAVIGRNAAIFEVGGWRLTGWFAWVLWAVVHVVLLVSFEKRLLVSLQWIWRYLTGKHSARLIDEPVDLAPPAGPRGHQTDKRESEG